MADNPVVSGVAHVEGVIVLLAFGATVLLLLPQKTKSRVELGRTLRLWKFQWALPRWPEGSVAEPSLGCINEGTQSVPVNRAQMPSEYSVFDSVFPN